MGTGNAMRTSALGQVACPMDRASGEGQHRVSLRGEGGKPRAGLWVCLKSCLGTWASWDGTLSAHAAGWFLPRGPSGPTGHSTNEKTEAPGERRTYPGSLPPSQPSAKPWVFTQHPGSPHP